MNNLRWSTTCNLNKVNNIIIDDLDIESNIKNNNTNLKQFNIDELIKNIIDINKLKKENSLFLLKLILNNSTNLNKFYFQTSENKKNKILIILNNILEITNILKNKINLNTIHVNLSLIKETFIPRSSYKFCNFKDNCNYNYNKCKNKGCYAHHYVYDLLEYDLKSIIYYIENFIVNDIISSNKEITKSLSTINYVIKHMYEELNNISIYIKKDENIEKYHKNNFKNNIKNKKNKLK